MKPRLLMVGNFASWWGGTTNVCEGLARRFEDAGWQVVTTSRKRPRLQRLLDMLSTTWRKRDEYDVAIVEVFSGPAFMWAEATTRLLTLLGKPYVLSLRGGNLPQFASHSRRRVGSVVSKAAAIVAQSGYLGTALPGHEEHIRLIPNPVDLDECRFRLRKSLDPRLVWLRSFHHIYNPSQAIQVVHLLAQEFPDVTLTMIGPDKRDGSLEAARDLARTLGVEDAVQFQGGVPKQEVPQWLDRGDIFINTTNIDNTPVSVQEAMACGLCVVSTDVGGVPYLLDDEVDALLVPPRQPEAMAAAVRRLLTSADLAIGLAVAARKKVEVMDWSRVVEKWEELLTSVWDGHAARDRQRR